MFNTQAVFDNIQDKMRGPIFEMELSIEKLSDLPCFTQRKSASAMNKANKMHKKG